MVNWMKQFEDQKFNIAGKLLFKMGVSCIECHHENIDGVPLLSHAAVTHGLRNQPRPELRLVEPKLPSWHLERWP